MAVARGDAAADAVIVLGAAVEPSGAAGAAMQRRVAHAVRIIAARPIEYLILSGGNGARGVSEAEAMRRLAIAAGLAGERIVMEDRARNTFENAVYSGRIMMDRGWSRVVLVTDAWHMRRALFVFRKLGLAAVGEPVRRPAEVARLRWARAYLDDTAALVHSAWLFRIGADKRVVEAMWKR